MYINLSKYFVSVTTLGSYIHGPGKILSFSILSNFPLLNLHSELHSFPCRKLKFTFLLELSAALLEQNKFLPPTSKLNLNLFNLAYKREDGNSNHEVPG